LKDINELYRSTFEQAAIGVVHVSPTGEYLRVNQRFCDIHGYKQVDILNHNYQELTHPGDLQGILENHRKLVAGEVDSFQMEKRNIRKDGTIVWVNVTASVARNSSGEIDYILGIIEDISQRKEAENAIQIQHQLALDLNSVRELSDAFNRLLDGALHFEVFDCGGIFLVDNDSGGLELVLHSNLPQLLLDDLASLSIQSKIFHQLIHGNPIYSSSKEFVFQEQEIHLHLEDLRTVAIVPIQHESQIPALLLVASHTHDQIPFSTRKAMEAMTVQIGNFIGRTRAEAEINNRLRYEMLHSELSTSFINLPASEVDQAIILGLQHIADLMDMDRISIMQLSESATSIFTKYTYSMPGAPSLEVPVMAQITSKIIETIQRGEIMVANSPEELLVSSHENKYLYNEMGLKSHAAIPLKVGGDNLGFMGINSFRHEGVFSETVIQQLRSLGEIFANALARKRAEEILLDREARYRSLFDDSPISLWEEDASQLKHHIESLRTSGVIDLEDYLNEHPQELIHFANSIKVTNVNRATLDLYRAKDFNEFQAGLPRIFSEESYQVFKRGIINQAGGQTSFESDAINLSLSGERINIHMKWSIPPGHEETWDKVLISIVDITKRKQAEEEHERLLTQVREIMNTVPEGVLLLDSSKRVILANPVANNYLKQLCDTKAGKSLKSFGDRPIEKLLTKPVQGLWHEVRASGRIFEIVARSVANHAKAERWVMVIRDVTQDREIQRSIQQQERLAAVGQMAAGIAHDFNNTLAVIVLYAEMLQTTVELAPAQKEKLYTIAQQARHGSYLVQQVLDFSRRAVLERHPMDLLPFLKEQTKILERTLPENINIKLNYLVDEYLVNVDPTRMQQGIINLAVNARDAMSDGGELTISLYKPEEGKPFSCVTCGPVKEGDWICISVKDTGVGIPTDVLTHIFEPFYTTKILGKGIGLGLSQVYGIFKQHDGHVGVITKVGQGSTFYLYLPALPIEKPKDFISEDGLLLRGQQETVLVVEDELTTSEALSAGLTLLNYRVFTVHDGEEALLFLKEHENKVDIVLSDVIMPHMGGIALFNAMFEEGLKIPLILMTGHPMQSELEEMQDKGLFAWILKPASLKQLAQVVSEALHKPE